jgi:DNA-binding response OmpR family regulator
MIGSPRMRVLLVEDEPRIHDFVRDVLEAEGIELESATDGREGLRLAQRGSHDLIVLDLVLPDTDGLSVLKAIRATRPDTPVLILTARSELPTKLRGFELGATDYLTKPFALAELVARVRVQLRRSEAMTREPITAGRLELDLVRHSVRVADVETHLSEREFALLRCLVEHRGEVVPRETLLAEVWGIEFDPGTNVVDVGVRRLRRKLGPVAPIVTVRHVGYRLDVDS